MAVLALNAAAVAGKIALVERGFCGFALGQERDRCRRGGRHNL